MRNLLAALIALALLASACCPLYFDPPHRGYGHGYYMDDDYRHHGRGGYRGYR